MLPIWPCSPLFLTADGLVGGRHGRRVELAAAVLAVGGGAGGAGDARVGRA